MTSTDLQVGDTELRAEFVDGVVKGFAEATYKFKNSLNVSPTSAWKNFFYREDPDALSAPGAESFRGIPRGANFPQASVEWQKIQKNIEKYGAEDFIFWEDIISDDVPVQERTLFRITEAVVKAVDDRIWVELEGARTIGDGTTLTIQSFNVGRNNATGEWGGTNAAASAAILDDLGRARQLISEKNYSTENLELWVSPRDFRGIITHITNKGSQFPTFSNEVAMNGKAGKLMGIQIIVSNSVTASNAMVVVPKRCATWKELVPLQTTTIEDKYKGVKVRAVELGAVELTDPQAIVLIRGTQNSGA